MMRDRLRTGILVVASLALAAMAAVEARWQHDESAMAVESGCTMQPAADAAATPC